MYQLATGPRSIGQVLDSIFKLFRASFGALLPFAIVGGLVGLIPLGYLFLSGAFQAPQPTAPPVIGLGYWVSVLVTMPVTFIVFGAAIARGEAVAQGRSMSAGAAVGVAAARVVTLIVAGICFMLAVALGIVLLVIPGLILMVSLYMFLPAIMLDDKGAIESLKFSHGLVWGNWWRTATIATIALVIVYVLFTIVGVAAGLLFMAVGVDAVTAFLVQVITMMVGGVILTPFFIAVYLEIYRDLKVRKLGSDLAARIDAVGTAR